MSITTCSISLMLVRYDYENIFYSHMFAFRMSVTGVPYGTSLLFDASPAKVPFHLPVPICSTCESPNGIVHISFTKFYAVKGLACGLHRRPQDRCAVTPDCILSTAERRRSVAAHHQRVIFARLLCLGTRNIHLTRGIDLRFTNGR